ncbi:hypothetical protein [Bartonella sp. CB60]|uniref:hypothetical protein n=1 Tax=Bartonella sp. CB60 TaxID=3113619 RepID=UPI00300DCBA6
MTSISNIELSDALVGLYDDYRHGFDIEEQLKLCVDLALSLELELNVHRLSEADAVLEQETAKVLPRCRVSHSSADETGTVIHMDFGGRKS